jgi:2-polyprenyl-3-methyl-5-hydroxy-6-metoxy-1,4-benzoquinol methylase
MRMSSDEEFLASATNIDFAKVSLNYESFRSLARNENLCAEEKIAFPPQYRIGFEDVIFHDIRQKLRKIGEPRGRVVDIGCGCGGLTDRIRQNSNALDQTLVLVDSPEMLHLQPDSAGQVKVAGRFPENFDSVSQVVPSGADAIICYSVLHYVVMDMDPLWFIDCIVALLAPGGAALIGDIPNASKRHRFFSSAAGVAFHRAFTASDTLPALPPLKGGPAQIDDTVLARLVGRAQEGGCHAYVVPQAAGLPMENRRDDMLIVKP